MRILPDSSRPAEQRPQRRRGFALIYLLGLLPLLALAMTLACQCLGVMLRANRVVIRQTHEYGALSAWLQVVRQDARRATRVRVLEQTDTSAGGIAFVTSDGTVRHQIEPERILRRLGDSDPIENQTEFCLPHMRIEITVQGDRMHVIAVWQHPPHGRKTEPPRCFETDLCVGKGYRP